MPALSRRDFVAGSSFTALSYAAIVGANDRLRIGVIGCGGQAMAHLRALTGMRESDNCAITNVCDVFDKRAAQAAQTSDAKAVKDYRAILNDRDIDYVLIATPEHWHYQMTMDAADAGKHIYCEKPMTHTVEQSKRIVAKIKQSNLKMQVGVQGMSDDSYETAHKYVKDGALGKVVLAQIDYSRNYKDDFWAYPIDADARPGENLDWKAWLGPAPKRPWDADRCFRWRRYWDYSSGIASDLFVHRVSRIIKALGLTFPERGVGAGGKFEFTNSLAEIPDTLNILLDYPGGPTVQLISSMANANPVDHVLRGHKATLRFTRTGFTITPERGFEDQAKEIVHEKTGAEALDLHHRNLMNAIRKNEPLKCDVDLGYYGVVACDMGTQSYRKRKYMKWDAAKERVVAA
ncbi:MAG TPA: Gfo/Idh/MocA family oxidoreductase [Bryobacteraceae bacterium]|nr:Gfo/Idh/MocA family oxidoreductase [Bryobacteraceae bacterium]